MNTDVEDLLREGMDRFTAELRAPAGLSYLVARRRRRRLALRSAYGVAAALAAGIAALAVVVVPGARDNAANAAAYMVTRVDKALSAAGPGQIAQMTITTRGAALPSGTTETTTAEEWSYGSQWRSVTYAPNGRPSYDEGFSHASVYTLVSYPTRTWARQSEPGHPALLPGPNGCEPVVAALPLLFQPRLPVIAPAGNSLPAIGVKSLRAAISCGALTVAGRQRVDGIEAIRLTSRPDSPISETIWVSPGTYLPVRVVVRWAPGTPISRQITADITWLAPTAQNLAKLTVPIPAGFRHVSLAGAVLPILLPKLGLALPYTLYGPLPKSLLFCQGPGLSTTKPRLGTSGPAGRFICPPRSAAAFRVPA